MPHPIPQPANTQSYPTLLPLPNDRGATSSSLILNGIVRITGAGHDMLVEFRDARVVRFRRAETQAWSENVKGGRLSSSVPIHEANHLHVTWAFCEAAADGRDAIRQDFSFDGTLQSDGTVEGYLSLRMVARFLEPQVVLADVCGPASLVPGASFGATHAA